MKTLEQQKEYHHEYYINHKEHYYQQFRDWCKANPEKIKAIRKRWHAKHPNYYRDYMRQRKAVTEPLVFEFLDNGFGDIEGYVTYLRNRGVLEQHIKWLVKDIRKYL